MLFSPYSHVIDINSRVKNVFFHRMPAFSLVEVVLAGSIFIMISTILIGAYLYGQESTVLAGQRARAALVAQEGMAAVQNILSEGAGQENPTIGFNQLQPGSYGLSVINNRWELTCSEDTVDAFRRQITITAVDDLRRDVTSTVTWPQNALRNGSVSVTSRITSPVIYNVGDWSTMSQDATLHIAAAQNGRKSVVIQGNYAYIIRPDGNPNLLVVDISHSEGPTIVGATQTSGTPRNIVVSGNYAYIAQDDGANELVIVSIANPTAPQIVGQYTNTDDQGATGVSVLGGRAYITPKAGQGSLRILNISNPANPVSLGTATLEAVASDIAVVGDYAYVASTNPVQELEVFLVADVASPSRIGTLDLPGSSPALSLTAFGTTVLIGQAGNSSSLHTVNVSTPSAPSLSGTFNPQGAVRDISLAHGNTYAFIATNNPDAELQVVNISNISSPNLIGSYDHTDAYAFDSVAYDPQHDQVVCASLKPNEELISIRPGDL